MMEIKKHFRIIVLIGLVFLLIYLFQVSHFFAYALHSGYMVIV